MFRARAPRSEVKIEYFGDDERFLVGHWVNVAFVAQNGNEREPGIYEYAIKQDELDPKSPQRALPRGRVLFNCF